MDPNTRVDPNTHFISRTEDVKTRSLGQTDSITVLSNPKLKLLKKGVAKNDVSFLQTHSVQVNLSRLKA